MSSNYYFEQISGLLHTHLELDPNPTPTWNRSRNIFFKKTIPKYDSGNLTAGKNIGTDFMSDPTSCAVTIVSLLSITEENLTRLKSIFSQNSFKYSDGTTVWTVCLGGNSFQYNIIQGLDVYEGTVELRKTS